MEFWQKRRECFGPCIPDYWIFWTAERQIWGEIWTQLVSQNELKQSSMKQRQKLLDRTIDRFCLSQSCTEGILIPVIINFTVQKRIVKQFCLTMKERFRDHHVLRIRRKRLRWDKRLVLKIECSCDPFNGGNFDTRLAKLNSWLRRGMKRHSFLSVCSIKEIADSGGRKRG